MPYFNLEDLSKIKSEKIMSLLPTLRVVAFITLAVIIGLIVYFQQRGPQDVGRDEGSEGSEGGVGQSLSEEEKKAILESLSAPADAPQYTSEEKRNILESLSAPSDQPVLSDEAKKSILESLSAPRQ